MCVRAVSHSECPVTLGTTWKDRRFEVPATVTMKNTVFWDVTVCSTVDVYRYFKGKPVSIFMVEE
jgi:hypothetical protein